MKIPKVNYGSVKHGSARGLAQCHSFTLIIICNKRRFGTRGTDNGANRLQMTDRVLRRRSECQARPYIKIQVRRLIDIRVVSAKRRGAATASVCSWCRRGGPGLTVLIH